jgi:hypothetical protein
MTIIFPSNTKDIIDQIRDAIGRPVYFFRRYTVPCSACSIDPISGDSTNSFCTVCSGEGYVVTFSGYTINGHITHKPQEMMQWSSAGQWFEGDVRVQVELTDSNITVIENTEYVMVDEKKFDIRSTFKRGVPTLNRVLIDLKERI